MNMILLPVVISVLGAGAVLPASDPGGGRQIAPAVQAEIFSADPGIYQSTIRFELPSAGRTTINIFDGGGRHVRELLNEDLPASAHQITWSGTDDDDRNVSAGEYFYMVTSGSNCTVGRMALDK